MPNRTALHEDNGMMTVLSSHGGRRPVTNFALALAIKIRSPKPAPFIQQHRVHSHHKRLSVIIRTRQMPPYHFVRHRQPSLVRAITAFDARLLANPAHPFIATSW
jgi:hypothetical protein